MRGSVPHPSLCQLFVRAWFQACTIASTVSTRQGSASSSPAPFRPLLLAKGTEHTLFRVEKTFELGPIIITIIITIIIITFEKGNKSLLSLTLETCPKQTIFPSNDRQ